VESVGRELIDRDIGADDTGGRGVDKELPNQSPQPVLGADHLLVAMQHGRQLGVVVAV